METQMQIESVADLQKTFDALLVRTQRMDALAKAQNNTEVRKSLRRVWYRLKQGPIRVLVMGVSSAGKSTVINAMVGHVVVPEGKRTTSPIPVWVRNMNPMKEPWVAEILERDTYPDQAPQGCSIPYFLAEYCYTSEQAGRGTGQAKYQKVEAAIVDVLSDDLAKAGISLIDTPGIAASDADTARVEQILKDSCEMLIIVFTDTDIQDMAVQEYFADLLAEEDAPLYELLDNDRLFLVSNLLDTPASSVEAAVKKHIGNTFGISEDMIPHRLALFDARDVRLTNAGIYKPVLRNCTKEEFEQAEGTQKQEEERIKFLKKNPDIAEESQESVKDFWQKLATAAEELCGDSDAVDSILKPIQEELDRCMQVLEEPLLQKREKIEGKVFRAPKQLKEESKTVGEQLEALVRLQSVVYDNLHWQRNVYDRTWPLDKIGEEDLPNARYFIADEVAQADNKLCEMAMMEKAPAYIAKHIKLRRTIVGRKQLESLQNPDKNPEVQFWENFFQNLFQKLSDEKPWNQEIVSEKRISDLRNRADELLTNAAKTGEDMLMQVWEQCFTDAEEKDIAAYLEPKHKRIMAGGIRGSMTKFMLEIDLRVDKLMPIVRKATLDGKEAYMTAYRDVLFAGMEPLFQEIRAVLMNMRMVVGLRKSTIKKEITERIEQAKQAELDKVDACLNEMRDYLHTGERMPKYE